MTADRNNDPPVANRQKPTSTTRPMTPLELQQYEDLRWAASAPEVQQHEGKFVVIHKKRVVAVGTDSAALLKQAAAQERCPEWELVVEIVPRPGLWEPPVDHLNLL